MFVLSTREAEARKVCLEFAAQYPTPAVQTAIVAASEDRVTWSQIEALFARSLRTAVAEVSA